MKIRFFGSDTCERCQLIKNGLRLMSLDFIYVDAFDSVNDPICDEHKVDDLPHVQILDDNDVVVWERAHFVSLTNIVSQLKYLDNEA